MTDYLLDEFLKSPPINDKAIVIQNICQNETSGTAKSEATT